MGYIRDWTDFAAKAEALVQAHPNKVRPVGAWRGAGGALVGASRREWGSFG